MGGPYDRGSCRGVANNPGIRDATASTDNWTIAASIGDLFHADMKKSFHNNDSRLECILCHVSKIDHLAPRYINDQIV